MSMPGKGGKGSDSLRKTSGSGKGQSRRRVMGEEPQNSLKDSPIDDGDEITSDEPVPLIPTSQLDGLLSFSSKFYIYDDHAIAQSKLVNKLRALGEAAWDEDAKDLDHVITDSMSEYNVLEELKAHPLRSYNPNQAELFIVPTPMTELLLLGCRWEDCLWYDEAFVALSKHPIFRMHHGHKHVLLSFNWLSFNRRFQAFIPALSRSYSLLKNVTVAHHFDPFGAERLAHAQVDSEYNALFPEESPPVTNAFSVGLGLGYDKVSFPMRIPEYDTFWNNQNFMFYHTSDRKFHFGTTKYRKAIFEDATQSLSTLPPSSVGFSIEYEEWVTGILSSKFCLVTRGDTPHSHSLFFAVRAGCIPVVVSDFYPEYAPPFKSSLDMRDFCIFIEEQTFLQEPVRSLMDLENLSEDFLRAKLTNLTEAQRIVLPDHEQSLFVPALLHEALKSSDNQVPSSVPAPKPGILEDFAILAGLKIPYRVPLTIDSSSRTNHSMLVGVLSMPTNTNARLAIRQTWAENRKGQVFFVVSGQWEVIEEEFYAQGDLIWLDMPEDFLLLTYKTQALFHALDRLSGGEYDYFMKTDDDSYVGVDAIGEILKRHDPGYWGYCMFDDFYRLPYRDPDHKYYVSNETWPGEYFPVWAQGMGYVLSRSFIQCALEFFPTMKFMTMEDVAIGIAAEHCKVPCQSDEWHSWNDEERRFTAPLRVEHFIKSSDAMLYKHWDNMGILKQGEFGDFE
jgi:hypothetical protein